MLCLMEIQRRYIFKLVLEHDNKEYTIYRKQEYIMVNGSVRSKPSQLKIEFKDLSTEHYIPYS